MPDSLIATSNRPKCDDTDKEDEDVTADNLLEVVRRIPKPKPKYSPVEAHSIEQLKTEISVELETHLKSMGYTPTEEGIPNLDSREKDRLREIQRSKRKEQLIRKKEFILKNAGELLQYVADGTEVVPESIRPELRIAKAGTFENNLFHFLTLYWSIPVSYGYGRRMRFLLMDKSNNKAIGLFGLTDPVFNLNVRDNWIGWTMEQKKKNLRSVMDAYVLGAVPPYSNLLGGKLVCTLLTAAEVRDAYVAKYSEKKAIISKRVHDNNLLLLTTTSALGKSSLYDRVRIGSRTYFHSVGVTKGYGHFHIPQAVFNKMRHLLTLMEHPYAENNRFGDGPNWRMRVIRVALKECGFNPRLLKHQIRRESFMIPLAQNSRECLKGEQEEPLYYEGDVASITERAKERWIVPRAERRPSYEDFRREEFLEQIVSMMKS